MDEQLIRGGLVIDGSSGAGRDAGVAVGVGVRDLRYSPGHGGGQDSRGLRPRPRAL